MSTLRQIIVAVMTGSPLTKGQDSTTLYGEAPLQEPRVVGSYGDWLLVKFDRGSHVALEYMTPEEAAAAGIR